MPLAPAKTPADVTKAPSLAEIIRRACIVFADRPAQMRPEGGTFKTVTYRELYEDVWTFAKGISALGLSRGDRVVILGETMWQWAVTDWACQTLGLVVVPIYPTLPPDQAQYIFKDCEAKAAICMTGRLAEKLKGTGSPVYTLSPEDGWESILEKSSQSSLERTAWEEAMGEIEPEDIATFIYTSGTTGLPKGAMLPHRCFSSLSDGIRESLPITQEDTFLSFLPLSHVFERYAGHILPISLGACVAYAGSLASLAGDMAKVKPTIMLAVPRFLEATRAKILEGVKKQKPLNQTLFNATISQGSKKAKGEFAPFAGLLDGLVGKKIRERTGGRIRFFASGGAALPPAVAEFYIALGIPVLQGYGLTETCAASSINHPEDNRPWTVGPPIKGVEMSLAADGEILIRGRSIMTGYYNLPEETEKAIDAEGWFHTGDIGEWDNGSLKITDRKKDILVLANGKNVAPQSVEGKVKESEYINEVVLFGDGSPYCYALIVPEFGAVSAKLQSEGVEVSDHAAVSAHEKTKALIKSEVDRINKTLPDFEKVKKHALLPKLLSVEEGELTPSMKVKRKVIKEKFSSLLKPMESDD